MDTPIRQQGLVCHGTGSALSITAAANAYLSSTTLGPSPSSPLSVVDGSLVQVYGGRLVASGTTSAAFVDRGATAYLSAVSLEGGTNSMLVSAANAQLQGCTFTGQSTRVAYASAAARLLINGGTIASGGTLVQADHRASIRMQSAPAGSPTYSPSLGTLGNNEGYIS